MSLMFTLAKWMIRLSGNKKTTALPLDALCARLQGFNRSRSFSLPRDGRFRYREEKITLDTDAGTRETFPCLVMEQKEAARPEQRRAILYVYGGGMLMAPLPLFLRFAKKMGERTGADIWFPYYPLCDRFTMRDAVRMIAAAYERMTGLYGDIRWYGFSSGGVLIYLLGAYLNDLRKQGGPSLPQAKRLVLVSPGGVPVDDEERRLMAKKDATDMMLSCRYMDTIRPLLTHGRTDIPAYMLTGEGADLTGFPETWIYYSTDEVLSVKAPAFLKALKRYGVPCHLRLTPGMPHCYCATRCAETQADYDEIIRILS